MSVLPTPTATTLVKNYLTSPGVLYVLLVTLALLSGRFPGLRAIYPSHKVNLTLLAIPPALDQVEGKNKKKA